MRRFKLTRKGRDLFIQDPTNPVLLALSGRGQISISRYLLKILELRKAGNPDLNEMSESECLSFSTDVLDTLFHGDFITGYYSNIRYYNFVFKYELPDIIFSILEEEVDGLTVNGLIPRLESRLNCFKKAKSPVSILRICLNWLKEKAKTQKQKSSIVKLLRFLPSASRQHEALYFTRQNAQKIKFSRSLLLAFLKYLKDGPISMSDFFSKIGSTLSQIHRYLKPLVDVGFITHKKQKNRRVFQYSLSRKGERALKYYEKKGELPVRLFRLIFIDA